MQNLSAVRAQQKQERARETAEIWEAISDILTALEKIGADIPDVHGKRATEILLRAGKLSPAQFSDANLLGIAKIAGSRKWSRDMGQVFTGEAIEDTDGETYICIAATPAHNAPEEDGGHFRRVSQRREAPEGVADQNIVTWSKFKSGHVFAPGDLFTDYGKRYRALAAFEKSDENRPAAKLGELYERVI